MTVRPAARVPRPRPFRLASLLALGALALSACAIGPNYHRPELPAPETYRDRPSETESIADLPWWEIFHDEALAALVRESLANNRDLAIAAARVEQTRYFAGVARGPLFPQAGYEGDAARGDQAFLGSVAPGDRTGNSFLATLNFAWEIDLWGRIRRSSEASRAELYASEAFRRGVVLSLISGVAQAYFELLELDLELEIAHNSVQSYQETLDLFSRQFRGGVTSKLDPLRAEAALAQAAAGIPELERLIVAKENELSVLVGRPAGPIARGEAMLAQSTPPDVPAGVPSQLLERRPDLVESEETLVAANARVGETLANFFPRIGLSALYGSVSTDFSDLFDSGTGLWSIAARAAGPLFTAGQTTYTWKAAQANRDAAQSAYDGAVLNALSEVSNALTARAKFAEERVEQERAVSALRESLDIAKTRYLGGLSTYIEVLDAQQQLYPAEFSLAQIERDQLIAVVAIYRALGGGWKEDTEMPSVPLPFVP